MNKIVFWAIFALAVVLCHCDTCPDHKTRCQSTQTCCSSGTGSYGCCPYQMAECCSDGNHCCPHGTTCDISHSRCIQKPTEPEGWTMIYKSFTENEWFAQNIDEDIAQNATNVKTSCGGGQSCPDKYTCCALSSGAFGCCPFDGATCCPDQIHCCPNGKTCDDKGKRCV